MSSHAGPRGFALGVGALVLILLALGASLTLPRLGSSGLWDPWEPRYAQASREMAAAGDWIVPRYREDPRLVKPPLTYWLIGLSQRALGVTETAARLPSALLATLCAAALGLALALRGRRLEGFLAGGALLGSAQWILLGRFATPDMPLAACLGLLLALALAAPALRGPRGRLVGGSAAVLLLAAAVLVDGPRGLMVPVWAVLGWGAFRLPLLGSGALVAISALYYAGQHLYSAPLNLFAFALAALAAGVVLHRVGGVSVRTLLLGLLLLALLVLPWYLAVFQLEPAEASHRLLGYKHGLNLGETPGQHTGPLWYVLLIVVAGSVPWVAAGAAGLVRGVTAERDGAAGLLAGAALGATLFFTLSEAQMGHFYALIQPAVAGLAGVGAACLVRRRDALAAAASAAALALSLTVVLRDPTTLLETATVFSRLHGLAHPVPWILAAASGWTALMLGAMVARRPSWAVAAVLPPLALTAWLGMSLVPALEPVKSFRPMWQRYLADRPSPVPLAAYAETKDSIFYYSDNGVVRLKETPETLAFLSGDPPRYLIAPRRAYDELFRLGGPASDWTALDETHATHGLLRWERRSRIP